MCVYSLVPNSINGQNSPYSSKESIQFSIRWRVDTGKCVDSSPLLCYGQLLGDDPVIFVGSHSGLFLSVEQSSGDIRWKQQLPDRIESSPCLSVCGHFVALGECVYSLTYIIMIIDFGGTNLINFVDLIDKELIYI